MHVPQTEIALRDEGVDLVRKILPPGEYVIGRDPEAEIHADTPLISRRHARLIINYDHLLLEDLGSGNGTFVNEQPLKKTTRLFPNQLIRLGSVHLEIRRQRAPSGSGESMPPAQETIRRVIPDALLGEKRYSVGSIVAQGGMGAILSAQQNAMKRAVAMKIMTRNVGEVEVLRFIEEAQITGQLAHPNIVPVYELGVDENDQLYYTMKLVRGITLRRVLEHLEQGSQEMVRKYSFPALLTIFQKVCDAVALAHSKGVIHRDIKPENIMLDDFGVVLLMDWGLAKVMGADMRSQIEAARSVVLGVRDVPGEIGKTSAGTILGTPQYMSPEQARGEVEALDARSDVYALGATLFQIVYLRPPVSGRIAAEIVDKVAGGTIEWPDHREKRRLAHFPGGIVPDSINAVLRKAMALEVTDRYQRVENLQSDLAAYQNGFATSAENATAWKQFRLLMARNKAASLGVAAVILTGSVFGTHSALEARRARREATRADLALENLRKTAPELLQLAASEATLQHFDKALAAADAAIALDPGLVMAYWRRGWILLAEDKLPEAIAALRTAQDHDPGNKALATLLPLAEKLAALAENDRHGSEMMTPIYQALLKAGALGEATPFIKYIQQTALDRRAVVDRVLQNWLGKPADDAKVSSHCYLDAEGKLTVQISQLRIGTLGPLKGLPIDILAADGCNLDSVEPLRGMKLTRLQLDSNPNISSLEALRGMPLNYFKISESKVSDLSPFAGMPLHNLLLFRDREIKDISPLAGLPLSELLLGYTKVEDYSALKGMPLRRLDLTGSQIKDVVVLKGLPLEELTLQLTPITDIKALGGLPLKQLNILYAPVSDLRPLLNITSLEKLATTAPIEALPPLRGHPSLKYINFQGRGFQPAKEFWAEFDKNNKEK